MSEQLKKKQLVHKKYYDRGSRPLSELKPNDTVYMQAGNRWIPAPVTKKANTTHSYIIKQQMDTLTAKTVDISKHLKHKLTGQLTVHRQYQLMNLMTIFKVRQP